MIASSEGKKKWKFVGESSLDCYFFHFKWHIWYGGVLFAPIMIVGSLLFLVVFILALMNLDGRAFGDALNVEHKLYSGETEIITVGGFLTLIQNGLNVSSIMTTLSANVLASVPPICPSFTPNITLTEEVIDQNIGSLNVFMMEKSLFTISFAFNAKVNFYVVNGAENNDTLVNSGASSIAPEDIAYSRLATSDVETDFIEIGKTGDYYFVALANETMDFTGTFTVVIRKSVYCASPSDARDRNQTFVDLDINMFFNSIVLVKNEGAPKAVTTPDIIYAQSHANFFGSWIIMILAIVIFMFIFVSHYAMLFGYIGWVALMIYANKTIYGRKLDEKSPKLAFLAKFFGVDKSYYISFLGKMWSTFDKTDQEVNAPETSSLKRSGSSSGASSSSGYTSSDTSSSEAEEKMIKEKKVTAAKKKVVKNVPPTLFVRGDTVEVVGEYISTEGGKISLRVGDRAKVVSSGGNGWVRLEYMGAKGFYPQNRVTKVHETTEDVSYTPLGELMQYDNLYGSPS